MNRFVAIIGNQQGDCNMAFLLDMDQKNLRKVLDAYCEMCFRHRTELLSDLPRKEPYSLSIAHAIGSRMMFSQEKDPDAYVLGKQIMDNLDKFETLRY